MSTLYVSELRPDCPVIDGRQVRKVFIIPADRGYREGVSLNSFFFGRKKRCWKSRVKGAVHLFTLNHEDDWEFHKKFMRDSVEWEYIPTANLWDFYSKIGYDYKTRKWLK